MSEYSLIKCIKLVEDELHDIYKSGYTDYDLLCKIQHLCNDISYSNDFKNLSYTEIEKLMEVFKEVFEEKFLFTRKV